MEVVRGRTGKRVSFADGMLPGLPHLGTDNLAFQNDRDDQEEDKQQGQKTSGEHEKIPAADKRRIQKSAAVICLASMVQYTALRGTIQLQNSLYSSKGLGTASMIATYASMILSCVFVPTLLIKRASCKRVLSVSLVLFIPYITAQLHPTERTVAPTAIILGLSVAPLTVAKSTYLTQISTAYAEITHQNEEAVLACFVGLYFMAFQLSQVWANLISSSVLPGYSVNSTLLLHDELQKCGGNFSSVDHEFNEQLSPPSSHVVHTVVTAYLVCTILSVLSLCILIDPLTSYGEKKWQNETGFREAFKLLGATTLQLKDPCQMLLIPVTLLTGMVQAFVEADFTLAYISCATNDIRVSHVLLCYAVANALFSALCGFMVRRTGRSTLIFLGAVLQGSLIVAMFVWHPSPEHPKTIFFMAGMWGVAYAIWRTMINVLYGILFPAEREAAFSNLWLWESIGFISTYASSMELSIRMKLYIMSAVLVLGLVSYAAIEVLEKKKQKEDGCDDKIIQETNEPKS